MNNQKIFGIGLNKTGTCTLQECGNILGYRGKNYDLQLLDDVLVHNNFERVRSTVQQYDLFRDWPWPLIYKELDEEFKGSKFILTVRKDEDIWFESQKGHSLRTKPVEHERILVFGYEYPHKHKKEYIEMYLRHRKEVKEYFKDRPDDFIELCWEDGDGWEKLCKFLGKEVPDVPFPHINRGKDNVVSTSRKLSNYFLSLIRK